MDLATHGLLLDTIPARKPVAGRPRKTCMATAHLLKYKVMQNPSISSSKLKKCHPTIFGHLSECTIQYCLQNQLSSSRQHVAKTRRYTLDLLHPVHCHISLYDTFSDSKASTVFVPFLHLTGAWVPFLEIISHKYHISVVQK